MTRYPRSEAITRAVSDRLENAVAGVVARSLVSVRYRAGTHSGWAAEFAQGGPDEVEQAVVLEFDGGVELVASWGTPGMAEGIDVEAGEAAEFPVLEDLQFESVVSDDGPWAPIRGATLESVSAAWQVGGQFAREAVWAIRLTFQGARRVVIALGKVEHGLVRYHPTGLLVFFDDCWFRTYQDLMISKASPLWQPVGAKRP